MRTLVTGFILFLIWSAICTYLYVNKIKDFSVKPEASPPETVSTPAPPPPPPKAVMPEKQVVYFDYDKADFNPDNQAAEAFEKFRAWIGQNPGSTIEIVGHTDAAGSREYNIRLGDRRARSVKTYLIGKGIPQDKITSTSKGEDEPAAENTSGEGRAKNRRSEITIK